jgi:hypothetical protein
VHDAHDDPILVINVMFAFVCEVIDITWSSCPLSFILLEISGWSNSAGLVLTSVHVELRIPMAVFFCSSLILLYNEHHLHSGDQCVTWWAVRLLHSEIGVWRWWHEMNDSFWSQRFQLVYIHVAVQQFEKGCCVPLGLWNTKSHPSVFAMESGRMAEHLSGRWLR